ncbi:DUF2730 domain-containing protein [Pseudotabrizicola algicola]|uniref:DUF2730 domain-containing protein n=1 Tax=Pseudotabrizicola algicola TaxID=2709381 RepID=A0A6B3RNF8_9RHOB|nr:DUF2730 domain-containing protein [Pseudotabrizicola algicola]NEX47617.1 DUF2730 domain-containing protein [Pseudotabrizicola algicola]
MQAAIELGPALAVMLAGLSIINILYTWWRTRDQNVETRFKAGSERMDRLDHRLGSVEQTLRGQPTKEDIHSLALAMERLEGSVGMLRTAHNATIEASKRQDIVLTRVEQYLLERK